jgi:hypothetical protein
VGALPGARATGDLSATGLHCPATSGGIFPNFSGGRLCGRKGGREGKETRHRRRCYHPGEKSSALQRLTTWSRSASAPTHVLQSCLHRGHPVARGRREQRRRPRATPRPQHRAAQRVVETTLSCTPASSALHRSASSPQLSLSSAVIQVSSIVSVT